MRVLFLATGHAGSGHVVLGLAVAAALKRTGLPHTFKILSAQTPFADLARRLGVSITELIAEDYASLSKEQYRDSTLFTEIDAFKPDILIIDLLWFSLDGFISQLPCKKVLLVRQVNLRFFNFRVPEATLKFRPEDYDLILKTEPGFELPFPSQEIHPIIIRNRDEIKSAIVARADLGLPPNAQTCLFPFNGNESDGADAWKSFSYLEQEGWTVVQSNNREGGLFPAVDWFNAFDMLVCGAGYSAFWEARYFRKEAYFVPYPRRFEDQPRRIAIGSDYEFDINGADELIPLLTAL